jgi:hypothetical protein
MISGRRAQEAVAMRGILNRKAMLACLVTLVAASVAACTARAASNASAPPDSQQSTSPAALAAASPAGSAPAGQPSATPTAAGTVQNLVISTAERNELTAVYASTYAADTNVPVSALGAPAATPGTVYYAYDPATDTYWALARFEPTAAMSDQTAYMDGTSEGMFKAIGTGPWQVTIPINPDVCQEIQFFPAAVLAAWSLPTVPPADVCPA